MQKNWLKLLFPVYDAIYSTLSVYNTFYTRRISQFFRKLEVRIGNFMGRFHFNELRYNKFIAFYIQFANAVHIFIVKFERYEHMKISRILHASIWNCAVSFSMLQFNLVIFPNQSMIIIVNNNSKSEHWIYSIYIIFRLELYFHLISSFQFIHLIV